MDEPDGPTMLSRVSDFSSVYQMRRFQRHLFVVCFWFFFYQHAPVCGVFLIFLLSTEWGGSGGTYLRCFCGGFLIFLLSFFCLLNGVFAVCFWHLPSMVNRRDRDRYPAVAMDEPDGQPCCRVFLIFLLPTKWGGSGGTCLRCVSDFSSVSVHLFAACFWFFFCQCAPVCCVFLIPVSDFSFVYRMRFGRHFVMRTMATFVMWTE
jgi:hypothetical protein